MALTPDTALLLGVETAIGEASSTQPGFARQTWLMKVLVEQLIEALPDRSAVSRAVRRLVHDQRGVTTIAVTRATEHLLDGDLIEPRGVGAAAVWTMSTRRRNEVEQLKASLSPQERSALRTAAQRTLATAVAWSNTSRASGQISSGTSTSGVHRRHPLP